MSVKATCTNAVPTIQSDFILYVSFILLLLSSRIRMSMFLQFAFSKVGVCSQLADLLPGLSHQTLYPAFWVCLFVLFVCFKPKFNYFPTKKQHLLLYIWSKDYILHQIFFNFFIIFTFFFPRKIIFFKSWGNLSIISSYNDQNSIFYLSVGLYLCKISSRIGNKII